MSSREDKLAKIHHRFLVLEQNGQEHPIQLANFDQQEDLAARFPELVKLINFEVLGRKPGVEPPSIKSMQALELINYEPASDSGHFRFYPKGALMLSLLQDWAEEIALHRFGAMQIETPILYDWSHPAIRGQADAFHERHYMVHVPYHPEKEFVLRFAGDFGLFCMVSAAKFSHRQLPLRIYEYSKSYRYEKRGELVGLRRLRGFSMPDIHCFCSDINQSWSEYQELYRHYADLAEASGIEYTIIFRATEEFYQKYKDQILAMLQYSQRPAVIEVLSGMKHYWAVKHEFQGIDSVGGACQVATVQLDVEDAERYGITYTNADGQSKGCVICHSSIGALERWIFLMLEAAAKMEVPKLPLWISPIQVRIIPVSDQFNDQALTLTKAICSNRVRADVDDRVETVSNRVRQAEIDWTPYILVFGEREASSSLLSVKKRGERKPSSMTVEELIADIHQETKGMPFRQSTLPMELSRRPIFHG